MLYEIKYVTDSVTHIPTFLLVNRETGVLIATFPTLDEAYKQMRARNNAFYNSVVIRYDDKAWA
jgi:hypothetical protein